MKSLVKVVAIAAAAVAGLGAGYALAAKLMGALGDKVSEKTKTWLTGLTAFVAATAAGVLTSKLCKRFLGAGGPSIEVKAK